MTDRREAPAVAQLLYSARERDPHLAGVVRQISRALVDEGRRESAGWLLLATVAPELVRGGELPAPTRALAQDAAELLAASRQVVAAAEILLSMGEVGSATTLLQRHGEEALLARIRAFEEPLSLLVAQGSSGSPLIADAQRVRTEASKALETPPAGIDLARLLPLLEHLGLHGLLGAQASALGRHDLAAPAWLRVGDRVAAARSYAALGEFESALRALVHVEASDPQHRLACVVAARLATRLDRVDYDLFHLVASFMASRPANRGEAEAMKSLAELFVRHGQPGLLEAMRRGPPSPDRVARSEASWAGQALPPLDDIDADEVVPDPFSFSAKDGATVPLASPIEPPAFDPALLVGFTRDSRPVPSDEARPLQESDLLGLVMSGRYSIERRLGSGGSGIVYQAMDLVLGEPVALKFLMGASRDAMAVDRFRREIKLARRLSHSNIVRIYDLGEERGTLFLSMELLRGVSLRALRREDLPPRRAAELLMQAAAGLQAAHDHDVIHRDVKPDNIFLGDDGQIKLTDFGLALARDAPIPSAAGQVFGTPTYMAPEQLLGDAACRPATDQYALGVVAYQLLTGRPPFQSADVNLVLKMHAEQSPAPPSTLLPSLPPEVDATFFRVLAKRPEGRFPSCLDFARALASALG